jgi:outer membrane protein TolC
MKTITTLLIILCTLNVFGQQNLSLSDAIELGLENNYDLQIVRKSEEVTSVNNHWGSTGALPSVNFNLSGSENFNINSGEDYRTQAISPEVSLNWVVFDGFSAKITKARLEEMEQQSQGNTSVVIESTIQDIIVAYNACLLQKALLDVYQELSDLSEDRYKRTEDSKNMGASTTYEMLQAKTSWLEDQSNYLQQKVDYENTIRNLNYLLAVENDASWNLTSELETTMPHYQLDDLNARLLSNNQTLKNQYLNQSLLARETALAKSGYYPKLSLNTGLGNTWMNNHYSESTPTYTNNSADAYIGLSLSFNIFNGGNTRRSVQIAEINEASEQVQTAQMKHSLSNQLLQIYSNYNVQKAVLELANEQETTAKLNLDLSADKLKSGAINSFNYRDVQVVYMNAAIARLQATYNLIQSNTDLLRITGGIINEYE